MTLVQTHSRPPQADESNVDDFSEIIYERQSARNSMSGFLPPPDGGVYLTGLTALTRLTVLTADRIDHVDIVDGQLPMRSNKIFDEFPNDFIQTRGTCKPESLGSRPIDRHRPLIDNPLNPRIG